MRIRARSIPLISAASIVSILAVADARMVRFDPTPTVVDFQMLDASLASPGGAGDTTQPSHLRGGAIAALAKGALVIDADSGELVRVNADGDAAARLAVGPGSSQLVFDAAAKVAYVANRDADEITVVSVGDESLTATSTISTHAEPYGVALTPDASMLLVTTVADQRLTAYATADGTKLWDVDIGPEPRGVAISADGERAVVTFLNTGAVARIDLDGHAEPKVAFTALNRAVAATSTNIEGDVGRGFARAAFAASYLGNDIAVVAHQTSTPKQTNAGFEDTGSYGGGGRFAAPITHNITFIADRTTGAATAGRVAQAQVGLHQPRALAYDGARDVLYAAGYGSDDILALSDASKPSVSLAWRQSLSADNSCGPNGLDVAADGTLLVYCSLSRSISTFAGGANEAPTAFTASLTTSRLSDAEQRGRTLFRSGNNETLSSFGAMACASCHPEGRADGLSWRIGGHELQTPLLVGRLEGTHPFKWDGGDATLDVSLRNTVTRLGGTGISAEQAEDLRAFLTTLPRPRKPSVTDTDAVARGKVLFDSDDVGCAGCHSGPKLTDRISYDLTDDLPKVDTPSLIGLAISAPYYHDGSAATLRAVVLDNGNVHGMGDTEDLDDGEIADLLAYLETL
jgi:DNA-binding beta-propeller fold protein YncE/mono/diheme cytochrome c family protein